MCFSGNVWCHVLKSNNVGPHFAQIFCDFARFFDKSKLSGVGLHPRLLCHLMYCNLNVFYFLWCDILSVHLCSNGNHIVTKE